MNNKNAYEIRLDVLKMAHEDAFNRYHTKLDILRRNADMDRVNFDTSLVDTLFPDSDNILHRADELYAFVEGK
jgi:hypothetical protein